MDVIFTDKGQLLTKETLIMMFSFINYTSFMKIYILVSAIQKVMMHPSDWLLEGADITFVIRCGPLAVRAGISIDVVLLGKYCGVLELTLLI
jgi:hypothetical protein